MSIGRGLKRRKGGKYEKDDVGLGGHGDGLAWYKAFKPFEAEPRELYKWAGDPAWLSWVLDRTRIVIDGVKMSEWHYATDVEPLTDGTFAMAIVQTFTDAGLQNV